MSLDIRLHDLEMQTERLTCWVIVVCNQHDQITASRVPFAGLVAELFLEFLQSLVQLVLRDQVASIMTQLLEGVPVRIGKNNTIKTNDPHTRRTANPE